MKIAILGDAHFGARNDSLAFHAFFEKFYKFFFKQLKENGVDTIVQLGDLWDRRKYVNFQTLSESRKYFFDELKAQNLKMITILGNHDVVFKNTLEVNSSSLLLQEYSNITVIDKPTTVELADGSKIAMIPWICADNYAGCFSEMNSTEAEICMGHFEIAGFEMYRGHPCEGGLQSDTFTRFDTVFSGHYHHRSTKGNISYLGTPYELTWQDYGDTKGFHIFDTVTRELTFIMNPYSMFVRLEYNDKGVEPIDLDVYALKDTYLKLVVVNKTDYYKFDQFINKLYTKGCHDIKIVEDMSEFQQGEVDETIDLEDTLSILSNYVDSVNTDVDKEKIKTYMKSLYTEAINLEVV
jgi:DNA repair exonuclease SbcCD nuclease subunit